jgi:hypothetical protein
MRRLLMMKTAGSRLGLFAGGALIVSACTSITGDRACTADFRYGLTVTVQDSLTSAAPGSALLIATSGLYVDSVGPHAPVQWVPTQPPVLQLNTAGERAGTYALTVRASGYRDWVRTGVRVTADECHVRPVALTARLQR